MAAVHSQVHCGIDIIYYIYEVIYYIRVHFNIILLYMWPHMYSMHLCNASTVATCTYVYVYSKSIKFIIKINKIIKYNIKKKYITSLNFLEYNYYA